MAAAAQDTVARRNSRYPYPYDRKEEIIFDKKRYRLYNNYVTFGGGPAVSSIRHGYQRAAGMDFQFHIQREYFQAGVMLSGFEFFSNNHIQAHLGYGYRRETGTFNLGAFAGPSYYLGVEGMAGQPERDYAGFGFYGAAHAIFKLTYDIGIGGEIFADLGFKTGTSGREQSIIGIKAVLFFSGAYKGPKRNYNPHVRAENPNG